MKNAPLFLLFLLSIGWPSAILERYKKAEPYKT